MELREQIKAQAAKLAPRAVERRQYMHKHPELSFQEKKTSAWILGQLQEIGIPAQGGFGGNGIRGIIEGEKPGPVVALRADFDALPITELNEVPFKSCNPGVMHACGHDAHTAILLTAGEILWELRNQLAGTIVLVFQPGEEKTPGGALGMIADGVLKDPAVERMLGEHINPGLEAGTVGFRPGLMMASADEIYLTVKGRGGHAASPHMVVDPISIASQIIVGLQQVVSRNANPEIPSVLSFGRIIGDGAMNVIPDQVVISGTFRTVDETWRSDALERIQTMAVQTARAMGADCEVHIDHGYPVVFNNVELTLRTRQHAEAFLGSERVVDLPLVMWAEDFAYYGKQVPACFYNLGVANAEKGWNSPLHSPTLMIDEGALETGIGLMAFLACKELEEAQ